MGLGSMAVPGVLAGLLEVHQRFGRLPLAQIMAPARHWATYGTRIGPFRAYVFQILAPILMATPATKAIYAPQGTLLSQGDRFYLPEFAAVLDQTGHQWSRPPSSGRARGETDSGLPATGGISKPGRFTELSGD